MLSGFSVAKCCLNCKYFVRLKHNPIFEDEKIQFSCSNCCVFHAMEEDGEVVERRQGEKCEFFVLKE